MKRVLAVTVLLAVAALSGGCSFFKPEANVTRDQWEPPVADTADER